MKKKTAAQIAWENAKSSDAYRLRTSQSATQERTSTKMTGAQAAWNSAKNSSGYIQRAAQQTVKTQTPTTTPKIEISTTAKVNTGRANGQSQKERQERLAGKLEAAKMQQKSGIVPGAKKETQKAETKETGVTNLGGLSRYTNRKETPKQELEGPRGTLNRYIQKPEADNRPEKKQTRIQKPTAEHYDAEQIRQYKEQEIGDYKKVLDEQNTLTQERYSAFQTAEKAVQDAQTAYEKNPNGVTRMQYLKAYDAYQKAWEPVQEAAKRSEELTNEVNSLLSAYQTEYDNAAHFAGKDYAGMQAYITELADRLDQTGEDEKNAETGQKLRQQYQEEIDRAQAYSYSLMDKEQLQAEYDSLTEAARAAARSEKTGPASISDSGIPVFGEKNSNEALERINEKKRLVQKAMDQLELREARDAYEAYAEGNSLRNGTNAKNTEKPVYDLAGQNLIDVFEKIASGEKAPKNAKNTTEITLRDQVQRNMEYLPENAKKVMLQFLTDKDYVSAANYYKAYEQDMTANYAASQYSELKNWAAQSFGTALAGSVGAGVVGAAAPAAAWIDNTFNAINNKLVDVSGEGQYRFSDISGDMYRGARTSAALQEGVQEYNATTGKLEGALNLASGALTSSVQNVVQFALFGAASLPVMAASAAGQSTYQGLKSGLSEEQAAVTSTVSGLIEYMTEKLPLEHLLDKINKISDGGVVTVKQIAEMVRKQGLEEASEEVVGNIADNLFDLCYNKDNSEYRQYSAQLQREGMSKAEADMEAFGKFFIGDSIEAAAAAYLSTILLIGGNAVSANLQAAQYGKDMKSGEKFKGTQYTNEEMQTLLFSQQIPEGYEGGRYAAERLIEQFRQNRDLSNRMLGFAAAANNQVMLDAGPAINEALGMGPDTQSYKMADAMMRQYEAGNQLPSKAFLETLKSQVEQDKAAPRAKTQRAQTEDGVTLSHYQTFLVQNGVGVRDAQNRTEVMNKLILGQSVSDAELRKMHIGAKLTKQMLYELTGVEIPEGITKEKDLMRYYRSAREGFEAKIRAEAQERTAQDVQAATERQQAYMAEQLRQEDIANRVVEATKTDIDEQLLYFLEHGKLKENAPTAQEGATEHGTESGETVLRGAGGWVDGQSDGEAAAAAAGNAEADARGTRGADRSVDAGVSEEVPQGVKGRGRAVSSRDFGLKNSTTLKTAREILQEDESAPMRKFREDVKAKYGYDVVYTDGDFVQRQDGRDVIVRGLFEPETKRIFVNANYFRLNYEQIGSHEAFHIEVANGDVDLNRMSEAFNAATGNAEILDSLVRQYMEKLSISDHDAALEEVFADMNGGFNGIRSVNVMAYQDIFTQIKAASPEMGEAASSMPKMSVESLEDGRQYVRADRQVIFGNDADSWSEQLEDYINGKIRRGQDVALIGADGDELILTATSAGKLSSQYTSDGRTMSETAFERKVNAATHIDELAQISTRGKKTVPDAESRHGDMASGGWNYRTAYFMDFDGKYYRVTISVANGTDGKMIYNIGKMEERSISQISGSSDANTGALRGDASSKNSIRSEAENVKQKNSTEVDADARKAHDKEALSYFGKTYRWNETGYVLLDGSKLDFSGRHEGGPGGYRTVDHRDIIDALGEDYGGGDYSGGMVQFMQEGNIRISPESGGINLAVMPTKAQMDALSDFISRERGEVLLDIDDANGSTISSTEYPRGTHANRVLQDIRNYFQNGVMPEVSQAPTVSQFRYSQETDEEYRRLAENPDENHAELQRMVDTAAKEAGYTKKAYHGTDNNFWTFSLRNRGKNGEMLGVGYYFAEDRAAAENYARGGGKVLPVYLDIQNPVSTTELTITPEQWGTFLDYAKEHRDEYIDGAWKGNEINKDFELRYMNDYDSDTDLISGFINATAGRNAEVAEAYLEMLRDSTGLDGVVQRENGSQVYVAFTPEQIKSADPVTRNDDGAIIPLRERFDAKQSDIRYSQDVDGISETGYTDETTDERVDGNGQEYRQTRGQDPQRDGRNSDRIGTGRSHGPIAKAERIGWDGIDEASRQRIRKTFGEFFDHKVKDEAFLIYDYLEQKAGSTDGAMAEFAKQLYDTMWDGDVVFENRWSGAFEDVDGLLTAIEDAAGYRNERYSPKYSVDTDLMDVWQEQNPGQTEITQEGFDTARRTLLDRYQNDTVLQNAYDSVGAAKNGNDAQEKVSQVRTNTFEKLFSEAEKSMDGLRADDMKYDVVREKESLEGAKARLAQDFDGEVADLLKRTDWTGEDLDTAMGALSVFREEAQKSGDYSKVIELAQKIRENGTKGGQFVQAFAKYNRTTPEGLLVKAIDEVEKARNPVQKKNANPAMQTMIDSYTEQIRDLRAEQKRAIQDAKLAGQMGQGKADAAELRKLRERYEEQIRQLNEQRDQLLADALQAGRSSQKKADDAAMRRVTDAYNKRIEQWQKKIDLAKAAYDELFQKGQAQQQQTDARVQEQKIQSYEEMLADLMAERDELLSGGLDALRAKNKGISDAKAQEITKNLTEMADALDAVKEGDVEALIDVIRRQAEIRKTPVSSTTLNNLRKQNFEWLWSAASTQYLQIAKDYVKPSIAKRVSTAQTISHLFNMRTGARNVVSNLAFSAVEAFANDVSTIPDMILGVFTGKRGVNLDAAIFSRENWEGFMEGYSKVQPELALDIETAEDGKYGTGRRTNKMTGNVLTRNLSRLERLMGYELNLTDEVTKGSIRAETLRQLQSFVDSGKMTMEEAVQAAEQEMLYRTFQDDTLVGTTLSQLKKLGNLVGFGDSGQKIGKLTVHEFGLGDILTKYTQVPGALVHRAIEFTPAGYAKFLFDMAKIAKNGGVKNMSALQQRNLALAIGRATTGTGLIALFAALTRKGIIINADDEDDPDAKALRAAGGISGTQINIDALGRLIRGEDAALRDGDELWGVEFMQPINGAMTIGALLNRSEEGKHLAQKWLDAIVSGTAQSIDDLSVMNTLQTVQNALEYSQEDSAAGKAKDVALELAKSSISGFVPSPIRQAAQGMDPYYRDAYGSKNVLTQGKEQIMNAIPGLRQQLPTKLTNFGEDKTYGGNAVQRWMNAFFTPGSVRTYQADETVQELLDLYYASGDADIIPAKSAPYKIQIGNERYDMSAAERRAYQTEMGQTAKLWMEQFFASDAYGSMTTEERAAQAAAIVKAAKDVAKNKVAEDMGIDSAKVFNSDITVETTRLGLAGEAGVSPSLPDSKSFSDPSRTGYKYELSNEELQQWQDLYNDAYTEAVGTVIQSDSYANADDVEKADMIRDAKDSANDSAKDEFLAALERAGIRAELDEDSDLYEVRKNVTSGRSIDNVVKRLKSDGVSENSISSAITSTIKDGYLNGDFTEKNANQKLVQYGAAKDEDDAYWKIREWDGGEDYKKYDQFFDAVEDGMTLDDSIAYYMEHGVEEKTLKSQLTSHYKPLYLAASASERKKMKEYLLDAYVALGKSRSEASKDIDKWLDE